MLPARRSRSPASWHRTFSPAICRTSADFFQLSTAAIDKSYAQLHEALLPAAATLIKARIARRETRCASALASPLCYS